MNEPCGESLITRDVISCSLRQQDHIAKLCLTFYKITKKKSAHDLLFNITAVFFITFNKAVCSMHRITSVHKIRCNGTLTNPQW